MILFLCTGQWCAVLAVTVLLLAPAGRARAEDPKPMPADKTTGVLFIAGGGRLPDAVRRHFVDLAGGKAARLVVIPTASVKADQPNLLETPTFFRALDVKSVDVLHTRDRKIADDPEFVKPLSEATGVWLTGGDQSRLSATYHGTLVEKELQKVLARGGAIGGTSAGAAIMSSLMIVGGTQEAEIGTGFGLLGGVVIDMHFQNRNRLHRLLGVLARHPECTGVGIDEETALVVRGDTATVEGNGNVRACFCPHGVLTDASVQVLRNGEKLDLASLLRMAAASVKEATEIKSADAAKPSTTNEHPATTMKP
jgi:cyanophycinase